jgi:hypothetical protein
MAGHPKILHADEEGMRDGLQIESRRTPRAAA